EGFSSGQHWTSASLGFVLTGVLMPFITLVVVAILGRGEELTKDLPKWAGTGFLVILYLTIGSTFAMPRITNVAYEMAWLPLGLTENNANVRFVFSLIFNLIAMGFMISPNTIISSVGKFMTPALLVLLIAVAITVFISPLSEIQAPSNAYENSHSLLIGLTSG
ncbi:branched-chain amino acid transport system II carrier protein, partial [Klebsiella pneumoniae]